ncbi:uncharacterized protein KQ657_000207 [Scheffersomyces spartinae]|uniref:Cyclin N-terminal domain-containing protein n=1 Tax=Scheffersomyces spartinae TaxID=45513 RepID=A0A9P7VDK4_9ASCO|nr:uncharacterized protein KQ657_000207 [Scheffersomyces spartinae]KAG7196195.1 hypothetical protein KQ657_000207 [Scheffersomyces spartinae]
MSDKEALKIFSRKPVSDDMIEFLVATTNSTIQVKSSSAPTYSKVDGSRMDVMVTSVPRGYVSLTTFIKNLIKHSNVQTPTLMATLVYLNKVRNILPANAVGMETTRHRIFLASLILAAKSLNDSSPLNKHWTAYTDGLLSNQEVNLAERELISLLKWDINIKERELLVALQPFLSVIKDQLLAKLQRETMEKANYYRMSHMSSSSSNPTSRSSSINSLASYSSQLSLSNSLSSHSLRSQPSCHDLYNNGVGNSKRTPLGSKSLNTISKQPIRVKRSLSSDFNLAEAGQILV